MYPESESMQLPESYSSLDLPHIKLLHVPESSTTATPILVIVLNRAEENNAFTDPMCSSIETVYRLINRDARVKVVVLTGAGKIFCAGADLEVGWPGSTNKGGASTIKKSTRDSDHRDR
jgi:enoyl-CoA hydratase/carnithine racemase